MKGVKNTLFERRNNITITVSFVLFGLMTSLIFLHYYSNNIAFSQIDDEIGSEFNSSNSNNVSNAGPLTSDQIPTIQQPPSGFVAEGTVNSVINLSTSKWLAVGDWSMTLNNGNVTLFDANMTWYNSSGTTAHTHELANFRPVEGERVVSLEQPTNNIIIKGVTDVGTNNQISWNEVPTTITFNSRKIVSISVDDNKTNHHFGGQPILGIVSSFVPCSDLPGPDMEVLPPCTVSTFQEDSFNFSNETLAPESFVPSQNGTFNEGSLPSEDGLTTEGSVPSEDGLTTEGSFPSEDGLTTEGSFPSEDSLGPEESLSSEDTQQCSELNIKNVSSSGFEDNPSDYHPPFDAVDGDSSTWWSNQDKNSWLKIDLGETNTLCGLSVEWNKGDTRKYTFEIEVSDDGNDFKKVFEGTNKVSSSILETYPIEDIQAQYLNLAITGTSSKGGWVSIKEINVTGRPMA